MSTPISHSSVAFLQSHPSYRYSLLLRILFRRTSIDDEYIRLRCASDNSSWRGMGCTSTEGANVTPLDDLEEDSELSSASDDESSDDDAPCCGRLGLLISAAADDGEMQRWGGTVAQEVEGYV